MSDYSTDLEWLGQVYYIDGDVLEDGLWSVVYPNADKWEFDPLEHPKWGITITNSKGEELEYADDDLIHVTTQVLNALYWFDLSLEEGN